MVYIKVIIDELSQGRVVQFGKIGNLQVGVRYESKELVEDVGPLSIRKVHLNFRLGKRLRNMLTLNYKLISG